MNSAQRHPRLLLAACLLCTFSVVGTIAYHTTPSAAKASAAEASAAWTGLPPMTQAERTAYREELAKRQASPVADHVEPTAPETPGPGYTLNPHGAGLVPTTAPGGFTPAEPAEAASEAPPTEATAEPDRRITSAPTFTMPGPRRPASAGSRTIED